jgi:hypothetical protein
LDLLLELDLEFDFVAKFLPDFFSIDFFEFVPGFDVADRDLETDLVRLLDDRDLERDVDRTLVTEDICLPSSVRPLLVLLAPSDFREPDRPLLVEDFRCSLSLPRDVERLISPESERRP